MLTLIFSTLISMVRLGRLSDREKDLEIMILRYQLDILEGKQKRKITSSRAEQLFLAIVTARLKSARNSLASQLQDVIRVFQLQAAQDELSWVRLLAS